MATITGTPGNDTLTGGVDGDEISGLDGHDTLYGFEGNDTLLGGGGSDHHFLGEGDDSVNPGDSAAGNWDYVYSSTGNDTVDLVDMTLGGLAINHFALAGLGQGITVTIDVTSNIGSIDKGASNGTTTILDVANATAIDIVGTEYSDVYNIDPGTGGRIQIDDYGGNDTINIGDSGGDVYLKLWTGSSGVSADLSAGIIADDGHGSTDTIAGPGHVTELATSNFADDVVGSGHDEKFYTWDGSDTVNAGGGDDWLFGGNDNDELYAESGNDWLYGGSGDDWVDGGSGNDWMRGEAGNDTMIGGSGNDTLDGGADADTDFFVFEVDGSSDVFRNFDPTEDYVVIDGPAGLGLGALVPFTSQVGANVVISGFGNTITIENTNLGDLDPGHFIFI